MAKSPTSRPPLRQISTVDEFTSWYWLKTELVELCGHHGLKSSGTKLQLEARIASHLRGEMLEADEPRRRSGEMPNSFTLDTLIGTGWRCNPALGAFFREVCGRGFRFNAAMRDFIHNSAGSTLADAAICYCASVSKGANQTVIAKQLEYNRHFREYFSLHPGATRAEAIAAWWEKRARRNGTRRA